jgi:gluconate:H+ symporter, GntP family
MSAMPLVQVLIFIGCVAILLFAGSRRIHPFIAIVVIAAAFGLFSGFSISLLGKTFGAGFSATLYSPGLTIIAAVMIASIAESTGAAASLAAKTGGVGSRWITMLMGLFAGIGASPASSFALLTPILPAIDGNGARKQQTTLTAALAIPAAHGLIALAPVPIAAAAILGAEWTRVALVGIPLALLVAALGAAFASWLPGAAPEQPASQGSQKSSNRSAFVLILAIAVPLLLLIVQSIGEFPSEPLGGGTSRELVIGVGRPLILFLVGVGIMAIGCGWQGWKLICDAAWTAQCLSRAANILLIVGAAGGLQKLCQETGMAELTGERLLGWNAGAHAAILLAFLIAAVVKCLQGSSLVAAITAAGMMQPVLDQLAANANAKALAALAIGAGAMTISHVNDAYFWLVADRVGLTPLRGLTAIGGGLLLQGLAAVTALFILSFLI